MLHATILILTALFVTTLADRLRRDVSVNHMRIRANIPAEQVRAIKAFLKSSNQGTSD